MSFGAICLFAGADHDTRFQSVVTSYDYDALLSEAGDPTEKLFAIRDVIKQVPLISLSSLVNAVDVRSTCHSSAADQRYSLWPYAASNPKVCLRLRETGKGRIVGG